MGTKQMTLAPENEAAFMKLLESIDRSLKEISAVLRHGEPITPQKPKQISPPKEVMAQPLPPKPQRGSISIEDVRMLFTKEMEDMLTFEDHDTWIRVRPRTYLRNSFNKIRSIIEEAGGSYVNATDGEKGHFRIDK